MFLRTIRPRPVTAALALIAATAGAALANAVVAGLAIDLFNRGFRREAAPLDAGSGRLENTEIVVRVGLGVIAAIMLASAVTMTVLAIRLRGGDRSARGTLWAGGALMTVLALATVCAAVVSRASLTLEDGSPRSETLTALVRAAQAAVPAWVAIVIGGLSGLIVLGYVSSSILLTSAAADSYLL
ncbi:MAG TPA: hypothetical protein VGJ28_15390 [Micromonosporaceae bacterium]|jgi:hypothetical protein